MTTSLYAEFTVISGNEARVREMMIEFSAQVRREPGNITFTPYVLQSDPARYFVYEVYRDDEAFAQHLRAEYGASFNAELALLVEDGASRLTGLTEVG